MKSAHVEGIAGTPGVLKTGLWLSLLPCAALAQVTPPAPPPPAPPTAGSLLQQIQPSVPQRPELNPNAPVLSAPRMLTPPNNGGPKIEVKGFRLLGLKSVDEAELQPLLQSRLGADRTLADLEDAAKDIEVALQRKGLFLAQVYVPEQNMSDGVVSLQVLEGRIGAVKLEVDPAVKVSGELLDQVIDSLRGNPVAERERIERALFVLGDLRGVIVNSSLTPGDKVGQADMTIKVAPGPGVAYSADIDNGGSIFTGRYRINAGVDWFNLAGRGDVASLKTLFSTNLGTEFVRGSWLTPVNAVGTKVGVAASFLKYKLGSTIFEPLDARGTAAALSLQLLHPYIRSRNNNVFLQASGDVRHFEDNVSSVADSSLAVKTRKGVTSYFTFGTVGDFRDTAAGGGITNYSVNIVTGKLDIRSADDIVDDQQGFRTNGRYTKLMLSASRLQGLPNKDFLYLSAASQWTDKNLDSSEKFSLGGPQGVRAYASPESPSDLGLLLGWEYRKPLSFEAYPGDFVFSVFGDYAYGKLHAKPLIDAGNVRKLASHGVGITYGNNSGLILKAWVAMRGSTKAQSDDSKARLYIQASKQF